MPFVCCHLLLVIFDDTKNDFSKWMHVHFIQLYMGQRAQKEELFVKNLKDIRALSFLLFFSGKFVNFLLYRVTQKSTPA